MSNERLAEIMTILQVFPTNKVDPFSFADAISTYITRFLTSMQMWVAESSAMFSRPNLNALMDDLQARDSGCPDGETTKITYQRDKTEPWV